MSLALLAGGTWKTCGTCVEEQLAVGCYKCRSRAGFSSNGGSVRRVIRTTVSLNVPTVNVSSRDSAPYSRDCYVGATRCRTCLTRLSQIGTGCTSGVAIVHNVRLSCSSSPTVMRGLSCFLNSIRCLVFRSQICTVSRTPRRRLGYVRQRFNNSGLTFIHYCCSAIIGRVRRYGPAVIKRFSIVSGFNLVSRSSPTCRTVTLTTLRGIIGIYPIIRAGANTVSHR